MDNMSFHKCYNGVDRYYIYEGKNLNPRTNAGNPFSPNDQYIPIQILREYWDKGLLTPDGSYADFVVQVLSNPRHIYEYSSSVMPSGEKWEIIDNKSLKLKILVEPRTGSRYHVIEDYYDENNIKKVDITKEA